MVVAETHLHCDVLSLLSVTKISQEPQQVFYETFRKYILDVHPLLSSFQIQSNSVWPHTQLTLENMFNKDNNSVSLTDIVLNLGVVVVEYHLFTAHIHRMFIYNIIWSQSNSRWPVRLYLIDFQLLPCQI